jgi:hypothetical protein
MSGIDIQRFLNNFNLSYQRSANLSGVQSQTMQLSQEVVPQATTTSQTLNQVANLESQNLQLNALQNMDRAVYAKEVLSFPKNLNEFIYMLQRGLTQAQFNQMFANQLIAQRTTLSQLQAQILAQLQGLTTSAMKEAVNIQMASQVQPSLKNLEILTNGMINLNELSILFQKNGKDAITKLIMSMTEISKSGVTDLTQLKEMAKLINASISVAAENNPQKTLKLLLMLYLPWLPLEDGVGFDLELQQQEDAKDDSDCILTISITTINYDLVKATIVLDTQNSVQVIIECNKDFPKKELQLRIDKEQKNYSMISVINFETNENRQKNVYEKQFATINTSQVTQINPYLLLMAHSVIKHVIDIDNNKTLGLVE